MFSFIALLILVASFIVIYKSLYGNKWQIPKESIPSNWKTILKEKVVFYQSLSTKDKQLFEFKIQEFILNYKIMGIDVVVTDKDKLLVASSAIIPIFAFPNWRYNNLNVVQLYPAMFNEDFQTEGKGRRTLGMVGTGFMEGKMILSKPALHHGFSNESDKKNTAIHEFVHLIDKSDNIIDGIPSLLLEKQYTIPWLDLINQKIEEIYKNKSDINPYGATNRAEFFAVISEYFFERPQLLKRKHPELYQILDEIFNQDMTKRKLKKFW
ncbi:MAG TPA: peptidase [Lutibacter sp.]|nr:peptidase [Lutibacter sp.]